MPYGDFTITCRSEGWLALRERTGLVTDAQLGDALGMNRTTVLRVMTGQVEPSARFIATSLDAFRFATFDRLFMVVRR